MLLKNKIALITGASKGIGKAIAFRFASEGARVILVSRDVEQLEIIKKDLPNSTLDHAAFGVDVSNIKEVELLFETIKKARISIDIIVNNAGVMNSSLLIMSKLEEISANIETNLLGTIYVTKSAVKLMLKKRSGSIINMSSILGVNGSAGQSVYSAAKSGIIGFTKSMSKELAPLNIRVNAIAPGFINTDLTIGLKAEVRNETIGSIGMKRIGTTQDISNLALFLGSDESNYITGQIINVDGGMLI
jgi:3-oxoacyl-[acyl-carrier protein] reductase